MSLESHAQELIVMEPELMEAQNVGLNPKMPIPIQTPVDYAPMQVRMDEQIPEETLEVLEDSVKEVMEETGADNVMIIIDDLPGAPPGTENPEIEVQEDEEDDKDDKDSDSAIDMNSDTSESKGKWDWQYNDPQEFLHWVQNRISETPKHSGYDTAGLERAIAYLERIDTEISKAMRSDLDGSLDADKIEEIRSQIDNGLTKLYDRRDSIRESKRRNKKKKSSEEGSDLTKEGQKITGVNGVTVTVPLLISSLARVCINSAVSAGKDIGNVYDEMCEKYSLNLREKAELRQLINDMGYHLHYDRGHSPDEEYSIRSEDNFDWSPNYQG